MDNNMSQDTYSRQATGHRPIPYLLDNYCNVSQNDFSMLDLVREPALRVHLTGAWGSYKKEE